jgi:hypothetical protein
MKEQLSYSFRKILQLDVSRHLQSWQPVIRNNWIIQFSVYKGNIMLVFTSAFTGQTVLRYFNDEDVACKFINFILSKNPAEEIIFQ